MSKPKTVALYLRVSTGEQTVENQRRDLEAAIERRGWRVVAEFLRRGSERREWARQAAAIRSLAPGDHAAPVRHRRGVERRPARP
jgi:DNA invertase Pin-like site-specific DNA recombinase